MKSFFTATDKRLALTIASCVLLGIIFFIVPAIQAAISLVVNKGEAGYMTTEVERADAILVSEIEYLDRALLDWSSRDDLYQWIQTMDRSFIENNLTANEMAGLGIDILLVINPSGQMTFAKQVDLATRQEIPLLFDPLQLIQDYPSILDYTDPQSAHNGLAVTAGQSMLLVSRAILTTANGGPARGTLVFIRLLDGNALETISNLTQRNVNIYQAGSLPKDNPALPAPSIQQDQVFFHPNNSKIVAGFQYLKDLNGQAKLVLRVENPRSLYDLGQSTASAFILGLTLLGLVLFPGIYYFSLSNIHTNKTVRMYRERYQAVVQGSIQAILIVDASFKVLDANPAASTLLKFTLNLSAPTNLKRLMLLDPDIEINDLVKTTQIGEISEHHCILPDGTELDLELSASRIPDANEMSVSITMHDITARKKTENALKVSEDRYMLAASGTNDGLWDWNLVNNEIYYSPRWKTMIGYSDEVIANSPDDWFNRVHPDDINQLRSRLTQHLNHRSDHLECEYRIQHKEGHYLWMLASGLAVWNPTGFAYRIAGSQTDITERKKIEEQLRHDALHDSLTGLGNRTLLMHHLSHANERKRRKPEMLYALFFLDLDKFKKINDSYGHQVGDLLLIEASHRLEKSLRPTDTISRFIGPETLSRIAGDEFIILLEDFKDVEDIFRTSDRLCDLLNAPYDLAGNQMNLSASIGLVIPDKPYDDPDIIIRNADLAMYRAKQAGGGRVVVFQGEMYEGAMAHLQMENDMRLGIKRGEFEVYYQPIYHLAADTFAGFEALVRWNHPQKGLLSAGEFIANAEETGLIVPIGFQVLEEACQQMQIWQRKFKTLPDLFVSVNLSARQIMNPELVEKIRHILTGAGHSTQNIWLEVTEHTLIENNLFILSNLDELNKMGIKIMIDDFGTGYSSFSYLQFLPINGFKIDQSFTSNSEGSGLKIIKSLVELGRNLGLTTVAEGIETLDQKELLKQLSCEYAQGYLLSRPLSAAAAEGLLKTATSSAASSPPPPIP